MEQMRGIGPPYAAWKAAVLPLNYICKCDSEETRTLDPLIKSQLLYHLSYRVIRAWQEPLVIDRIWVDAESVRWWRRVVSNHRTRREQIYSLPRLATSLRLHLAGADYRNRTYNLLITNQLLCQLSQVGMVEVNGLEPLTLCL